MTNVMFSSRNMSWCTPQDLFEKLNNRYHFTLDAAASDINAKCKAYFTKENDGLSQSWKGHTVFCNPPYGREVGKWVKKAHDEYVENKVTTVLLLPARTDTSYWHDYIFGVDAIVCFLRGRLRFTDEDGNSTNSAPFPSALIIYDPFNVSKMPFITMDDILKGEQI